LHDALPISPQSAQCSGGLSPGPFCVEFACSPRVHKGFPPIRTPTEKTCKNRAISCPSVTETDGSLGGSWRKDGPGWVNCRAFTATSGLCVRVFVCPVSPPKKQVCVAVCRLSQ